MNSLEPYLITTFYYSWVESEVGTRLYSVKAQLELKGKDEIIIEYNATISPLDPNPPNSIIGWAIMQSMNFTKELMCVDPFARQSGWFGRCFGIFWQWDKAVPLKGDCVTLSISLSLLYGNVSRENATGVNCDDLRLQAFKSTETPLNPNSISESSITTIVTELDQQYAKVRLLC